MVMKVTKPVNEDDSEDEEGEADKMINEFHN
jgi:hypothetical protein